MSSKNYFDTVSMDWDVMRTDFFSDNIRASVYKQIVFIPEMVIADIGAGTGFMTEGLIGKNVKVIAVDQSENMLAKMKEKFFDKIEVDYRLGVAESLPIESSTMDYVLANMYLHHVENPEKAIAEMYRVLKLNGKLIITDLDSHNYEFLRIEQHDRWLGFERNSIMDWFKKAGFADNKIHGMNENCCSESKSCKEKAKISVFMALGKK